VWFLCPTLNAQAAHRTAIEKSNRCRCVHRGAGSSLIDSRTTEPGKRAPMADGSVGAPVCTEAPPPWALGENNRTIRGLRTGRLDPDQWEPKACAFLDNIGHPLNELCGLSGFMIVAPAVVMEPLTCLNVCALWTCKEKQSLRRLRAKAPVASDTSIRRIRHAGKLGHDAQRGHGRTGCVDLGRV